MRAESRYRTVDGVSYQDFVDWLFEGQVLQFSWRNNDYLLERFDKGYLIADPLPYYDHGGDPNDPHFQYPESFHAKTPQELLELPFVAGKTLAQRWDEIKVWE